MVVVVATHGEERLHLLTGRALRSIAEQSSKPAAVIVVSDNDPLSNFLDEDEIKRCFDDDYKDNVHLICNTRTRGNSGTGAWNTGIIHALAFWEDYWVAILDDDDEWLSNHIELCLKAAGGSCQWIASGIVRGSKSGRKSEPLPIAEPRADDFFTTNPGIQGSNLFVQVKALLGKVTTTIIIFLFNSFD